MNKLRILHTNFHKYLVGEAKRVLAVSAGLHKCGHHVILASPAKSALIKQAKGIGLQTFEQVNFGSGFNPMGDLADILALRGLINRERIDIVHTHGSKD